MDKTRMPVRALVFILLLFTVWRGENVFFLEPYHIVQVVYYLLLVCFMGYYVYLVLFRQYRPSPVEWFLLAVMLIPLLSAWRAWFVFDQPLRYGLLAERRWGKASAVILLIFLFRKAYCSRRDLQSVLVLMSVLCLVVYASISLFLDPVHYLPVSAVWSASKGYMFRLNPFIVLWGLFFFTFHWLDRKRYGSFLLAVLLAAYLMFLYKGRVLSLVFLLALVIVVAVSGKWRQWIPRLVPLVIVVALLFFPLRHAFTERVYNSLGDYPRIVDSLVQSLDKNTRLARRKPPHSRDQFIQGQRRQQWKQKWKNKAAKSGSGNTFLSVTQENESASGTGPGNSPDASHSPELQVEDVDRSSHLRIQQARKAIEALNRSGSYWLFGHGYLSRRWKGGFSRFVRYFHVADIGPLGVVFLYGVIILLFLSVQFVLGLVYGWRLVRAGPDVLDLSFVGLWLYAAGRCILGPYLGSFPGLSLLSLGLIYIAYRHRNGDGVASPGSPGVPEKGSAT